ncbi:MAG: translation elongation factor Ts [Kiritimatiellae bacterium]|nr:translation elongation factor Ts [Kiritimatiellia bacterium]
MTEITAASVKALRDETNAGMMECKRALGEAGGDKAKALRILRERGIAIAEKKSSRAVNQGVIAAFIAESGKAGSLIEVNCETDFVAKNDGFRSFTAKLAEKAAAMDNSLAEAAKTDVTAKIAEIGENIVVRRNIRFVLQKPGIIAAYIHHGSAIGVLVELNCAKNDTASKPAFNDLAKDICLQVAASQPRFLDRASVPPAVTAAEKEIFAKQITGKPPQIVEKIVEGKLGKFYEQVCLLEQPFVKDQDKKIASLLAEKEKELADEIKIVRFARFQTGEAL